MTEKMMHLLLVKLKLLAIVLLLALLSLFTFSFTTSRQLADDLWKQMGITQSQGTDAIKQSFLNGYLHYYAARNARHIATGNRAAVAKDLLAHAKQFISSESFKKAYEQERKQAMPQVSTQQPATKQELHKKQIAETEKAIKSSEEISKMSAEMTKAMKPNIEMYKKQLIEYKDPNNPMLALLYESELEQHESRKRSYTEDRERWEKNYPADYRMKIKERLQKYLDLAATVDFTAELKQAGNKKKFVKPAYESKPYDWKQVYRAGKEVYDVAKPFAEQWIKEMGVVAGSGSKAS